MCKRWIIRFFRSYLQLFNLIHAAMGLCLGIFGVYMLANAPAEDFAWVVTGIAGFVFFDGVLGWVAVMYKIRCLLKLYVLLMLILCFAQITLCILLLTDQTNVIGHIDVANQAEYDKIEAWIKKYIYIFITIEAILALIELLFIMFACCCAGDFNHQKFDSVQTPLL